ncbi:hypothetical protein [Actinoplanes sp. NPDC026623]|uniref:hypothetical protein n=1 Tax=Actinoplanes sp. NPDC026623 TaxID=3155610 RepID=UPI00340678D0
MHPYRPPASEPEPSFLSRDLAGFPIWVHLVTIVITGGLYLLVLPFLFAIEAYERVAGWAVGTAFTLTVRVLRVPARILYRLLLAVSQRVREEHRHRTAAALPPRR